MMSNAGFVRKTVYPFLAICFVGFLIYSNSLHGEFQFDDWSFLAQNPDIYHLQKTEKLASMHQGRPIPTASFALDYYFSGVDPFSYHVTNLIIHLVTSLMVWWFVRLILSTPVMSREKISQDQEWLSFLIALFFLSHPVATNAITYINQRYTSMSAMFYMISICFYVRARLGFSRMHQGIFCFIGSAVAAVLGMFCKETLIMLPFIIIVLEVFFFKHENWKERIRSRSFWLGLVIFLMIALVVPYKFGFNVSYILESTYPSESHDGDIITSYSYFLTEFRVLVTYLKVLFFPFHMQFDYDFPVSRSFLEPATFLSFLFLFLIWFWAVKLFRHYRIISFGIVWFFINLVIESSIIPIPHVIWEYRLYLPSVGFCLALGSGIYYLIRDEKKASMVMASIILIFCFLTIERNKIWQNEIVFWQDAVKKAPNKSRPYDNLGAAYLRRGNYQEAIRNLEIGIRLNPNLYEIYNNIGQAYISIGDYKSAVEYLNKGLLLEPEADALINNLGVAYLNNGEIEKAEEQFLRVVRKSDLFSEPASNLAKLYYKKGDMDKAVKIYRRIIETYPHRTSFLYDVSKIYLEQKDYEQALWSGNMIVNKVDDVAMLLNSAGLFAQNNQVDLAVRLYSKAMRMAPGNKIVYIEAGKLFGNLEQFDQAIAVWREGQRIDPQESSFQQLIDQAETLKRSMHDQ